MKKTLNELSLLPNLGLGAVSRTTGTMGTGTSTSGGLNTAGSKSQTIAKSTAMLTKQINDITNKIATAKQKAAQSSQGDQQKLVQTIALLQKQLQTLSTSENEESGIKKAYKAAYKATGEAIGARTGIPGAKKALGKMGEYSANQTSKFFGLENKKNKTTSINNNKDMRVSNKTTVKEGILPAIGKAVKGVTSTAGNVAGLVPVVGAPVKAAADLAGDVATGVLGGDENEETHGQLTPIQDQVVSALARKRYHINKVSHQYAEEEGGPSVYMSKRPNKYSTRYAEVAPDGSVNGMTLKEFLGSEENEERVLTKKQQVIAKAAPPYDKITGADFSALKKESTNTKNFLKAVLQKNYSEADKYLGSLVNEKIKNVISKAIDKTK